MIMSNRSARLCQRAAPFRRRDASPLNSYLPLKITPALGAATAGQVFVVTVTRAIRHRIYSDSSPWV